MKFVVHQRGDGLLVVLPALLAHPPGLGEEGVLVRVGSASAAFSQLSDELATAIALHGYGIADDRDEALLRLSLDIRAASAPTDAP